MNEYRDHCIQMQKAARDRGDVANADIWAMLAREAPTTLDTDPPPPTAITEDDVPLFEATE